MADIRQYYEDYWQAPEAYDLFLKKRDNCEKVVLRA